MKTVFDATSSPDSTYRCKPISSNPLSHRASPFLSEWIDGVRADRVPPDEGWDATYVPSTAAIAHFNATVRRGAQFAHLPQAADYATSDQQHADVRSFLDTLFHSNATVAEPVDAAPAHRLTPTIPSDLLPSRAGTQGGNAFDFMGYRPIPSTTLQRKQVLNASGYAMLEAEVESWKEAMEAQSVALDTLRAEHDAVVLPETLEAFPSGLLGRNTFVVMYRVDSRDPHLLLQTNFGPSQQVDGIVSMLADAPPRHHDARRSFDQNPLVGSAGRVHNDGLLAYGIPIAGHASGVTRQYAIRANAIRGVSWAENFRYRTGLTDYPGHDFQSANDEMHLDPHAIRIDDIYLLNSYIPQESELIGRLMLALPYDVYGVPLRDFVHVSEIARAHHLSPAEAIDHPTSQAFISERHARTSRSALSSRILGEAPPSSVPDDAFVPSSSAITAATAPLKKRP